MAKKKKKSAQKKKKGTKYSFKKNVALWQLISPKNKNKQQREVLIQSLNKTQMNDISRLLKAFMSRKLPVSSGVISKLKKDKQFLYCLANCATPLDKRKEIVRQKGGFLPLLLPMLLKGAVGAIGAGLLGGGRR